MSDEVELGIDFTGEDLTLNERIDVETICGGRPFPELVAEGSSVFLRAVAWVVWRRSVPTVTLQEAGELKVRFTDG